MKVFLLISACFLSASASLVEFAKVQPFHYEDCGKGNRIANISRFTVSPYPVSLSKNITASVDINLFEDIPPNALMRMKIYKITSLLGIKIPAPCIAGIGSCTTEHCKFLGRYKDQACSFFQPGVECECPIKAGYFGGNNITVPIPQLGSLLKFIASGKFKIEMQLIVKDKSRERMIACYAFSGVAVS